VIVWTDEVGLNI